MATPPKPVIGDVTCPFTRRKVPVKRDKNGRFFIVSPVGHLFLTTSVGQQWIMDNARLFGDDEDHRPDDAAMDNDLPSPPQPQPKASGVEADVPPADPPDIDAPEPIDTPPAPKQRRSLLDSIL